MPGKRQSDAPLFLALAGKLPQNQALWTACGASTSCTRSSPLTATRCGAPLEYDRERNGYHYAGTGAHREILPHRLAHYRDNWDLDTPFAGLPKHTAVLRFTPERACSIAEEQWQQCCLTEDGSHELRIPCYPRELGMDILKYGSDVEVMALEELRQAVVGKLCDALGRYEKY